MSWLQITLMSVQLLVAVCTLLGMLYAFKTFLSKPKDSMIKRIIELEVEVKEFLKNAKENIQKFLSKRGEKK